MTPSTRTAPRERPYTPATLADRWGCSARHIRNLIDRGELPAFRVGGKLLRISHAAVEDFECRNSTLHSTVPDTESAEWEAGTSSSIIETVVGIDDHSARLTAARLNGLRRRSSAS